MSNRPAPIMDDEPHHPEPPAGDAPVAPVGPINELESRLLKLRKVMIFGEIHDRLARDVTSRLLALAGESDAPIDVYINSLRKKVERTGWAQLIHTARGVGYVLRDDS